MMNQADRAAVVQEVMVTAELFSEALSEAKLAGYFEAISDLNPDDLRGAFKQVRRDAKFFPRPAEIREAVARLTGTLLPSPEEVLALIRQSDREESVFRRDGSFAYTERFWDWPEDASESTLRCARRVIEVMGDPVKRDERVFGWEQQARAICAKIVDQERAGLGAAPVKGELPA